MAIDIAGTEPPLTLDQAPVRALGLGDQLALWGNLGVSLLLPVAVGVFFLFNEDMSLAAGLTAILVGTLIGNTLLGLAAVPGAETGAPAMVLLRGLFGRTGSYVPTALNLLQCLGWATFEIFIIAEAADRTVDFGGRWLFVIIAGVVATAMAVRPLAVVQVLKRYVVWLALASTLYLLVQLLREDLPALGDGTWDGFWPAADLVAALSVSWMPLAADYTRQSRSARDAFWGAAAGYAASSAAFFVLGLLALVSVVGENGDVIDALLAIPAGGLALLILAVDEIDEAFANIYSTAVSGQNLAPRVDRRVLAIAIGAAATVLALLVADLHTYESFLFLIGSVFVPLFATFIVDYYVLRRRQWDTSEDAPPRWEMLLPWFAGFATYQLVAPTYIEKWEGWAIWWTARQDDLGFTPPTWIGATIASFAVAAVLTLVVGRLHPRPARSARLSS